MKDFLEVEYNQESLVYLLKAVKAAYTGKEQAEANGLPTVQNIIYKLYKGN